MKKVLLVAAILILTLGTAMAAQWDVLVYGNADPMCYGTAEGPWAWSPSFEGGGVGQSYYIDNDPTAGKVLRCIDDNDAANFRWVPHSIDRGQPVGSVDAVKNYVPGADGITVAFRFKINSFTVSSGEVNVFVIQYMYGSPGKAIKLQLELGGTGNIRGIDKKYEDGTPIGGIFDAAGYDNAGWETRQQINFADGNWHTIYVTGRVENINGTDTGHYKVWYEGGPYSGMRRALIPHDATPPNYNNGYMTDYDFIRVQSALNPSGKIAFQNQKGKIDVSIDWFAMSYNYAPWDTNPIALPVKPAAQFAGDGIGAAKSFDDSALIGTSTNTYLTSRYVVGKFGSSGNPTDPAIFVEEDDRSAGIMVVPGCSKIIDSAGNPIAISEGDRIQIKGNICTIRGKKAISAYEIKKIDPPYPATLANVPLAVTNKAFNDGFNGMTDCTDMLVRVCGQMTYDPGSNFPPATGPYFYIDDGSGLVDNAAFTGVAPDLAPVKGLCIFSEEYPLPYMTDYVAVTGIACTGPALRSTWNVKKVIPIVRAHSWDYWDAATNSFKAN